MDIFSAVNCFTFLLDGVLLGLILSRYAFPPCNKVRPFSKNISDVTNSNIYLDTRPYYRH